MTVPVPTSQEPPKPRRRRVRADARRSVAAILDAAVHVLGERPQGSIDDVAKAAGVTRQTVYAHFPSREALISAALDHLTDQVMDALDASELDQGSATAGVIRMLDAGWEAFEQYRFLAAVGSALPDDDEADRERHVPVADRLERLIRRGQDAGEFDSGLPSTWLVTATISLGHSAGTEVTAGRMTHQQAADAVRTSVLRLLGASSDG